MLYTFRFDRSERERILRRLISDNTLSQGWGGGDDGQLELQRDDFREATVQRYDLATSRIPSNVLRMRDFHAGDLLVTPHLPEDGKVSVHEVAADYPECYDYVPCDPSHQNHRIRISASYGLGGEVSASHERLAAWKAKLPWMRLPIFPGKQYESLFRSLVDDLASKPNLRFEASALDDYVDRLRRKVLDFLENQLQNIAPSGGAISFEAICERLVTVCGYEVTGRNQYDREGGDADLTCVRDRREASPFEVGETRLFVQIKKHRGTSDDQAVKQLLKIMAGEVAADGCVMSLAANFDDSAQRLAGDNGIALMNADTICGLLLAQLADEWAA